MTQTSYIIVWLYIYILHGLYGLNTLYESRRKRHDHPRLPPPSAVARCAQRSDQDNQAPGKDRLPERGHFAWWVCDENIGPEVNSENPTAAGGDAWRGCNQKAIARPHRCALREDEVGASVRHNGGRGRYRIVVRITTAPSPTLAPPAQPVI